MIEGFKLDYAESTSPLWMRLSNHLAERRNFLRAQNDGDKDTVETALIRGRIRELTRILGLEYDPDRINKP